MNDEIVTLPRPIEAKGRVKIELFEGDEKVHEQESDNFIAKGMDKLYMAMMSSVFTRSKYTGGTSSNPVGDPFNKMLLTNASHEVDPETEWLIKGRVIGYAFTDSLYAGADKKRGSYNANESNRGDGKVHIVVDFATDAGNGTIESVYFSTNHYTQALDISQLAHYAQPFGTNRHVEKYNNKYYVLDASNSTSSSGRTISIYGVNFELEDVHTLANDILDFTIYDDQMYLIRQYNAPVYKVPLNNLEASFQTVYTPSSRPSGIVYNPDKEQFMLRFNSEFSLFDKNFNILSTQPTELYFDTGSGVGSYREVDMALMYADGEYFDRMFLIQSSGQLVDRGGGFALSGVFDNFMVDTRGFVYPKIGFSSRFKLDSPVTKTSTNTMKVTYDFILPSIYD